MKLRVLVRSTAEADLLDNALFIADDNPNAAQRFLDAAEQVLRAPRVVPRNWYASYDDRSFARGRLWPVPGFENFLICYIPRVDHIDVLRVLHGARDWQRFFE